MATFGEIQANVKFYLNRESAQQTELTAIATWINQTIREDICAEHNWSFMDVLYQRNTVAQRDLDAFPAQGFLKDVEYLLIQNDPTTEPRVLDEKSEAYLRYRFRQTVFEIPRVWAQRDFGYRLRPMPDRSDYILWLIGWQYPPPLVNDNDTNDLTLNHSRLVEVMTTARGLWNLGEDTRAQYWEQLAQTRMAQAKKVDRLQKLPARQRLIPSISSAVPGSTLRRRRFRAWATSEGPAYGP